MSIAEPPGHGNLLLVASTGGSVLGQALRVPSFRDRVVALIVDRECGAIQQAASRGIRTLICSTTDAQQFSNYVDEVAQQYNSQAILSFYLRLFRGRLLERMSNRIVNFHPSLLPAFPGFGAFERSLESGARFIGNTAHFIDDSVDNGPIIAQSMMPCPPDTSPAQLRHGLFVQQCRLLVQVAAWTADRRISVQAGKVTVAGARYSDAEFSPALDDSAAIALQVPMPPAFTLSANKP